MGRGSDDRGVRPRDDGIQIDFVWRLRRFRQLLKLAPTPANMRYAAKLRAEIRERIKHGTFRFEDYFPEARNIEAFVAPATARDTTFDAYGKLWMQSRGKLEHSTKLGYQSSIDAHLTPKFGGRRIETIAHSEAAAFFGGDWTSNKTRNNALIPARGIFRMAKRDGVLASDPMDGIENQAHQAPEPDPFTQGEAEAIIGKVRERHSAEAEYFVVAFWTGMRPSELVALLWDDVDLAHGTLRVHHARVRGHAKDSTKTHQARTVELMEPARAAMQRARAVSQLADQEKSGGHVFLNPTTGSPYPDDQIPRRRWREALTLLRYGMRDAYQTRHSYASWLVMAGAKPGWIAGQLGHSVEVLFRRYARWINRADNGAEKARVEAVMQAETARPRHEKKADGS